jgi:hypothetical protein
MVHVVCPFCLKAHDFVDSYVCLEYPSETVPPTYVRDYAAVPPLWLVTMGFSGHGKTTYLAALTLMLENIGTAWQGMFYRPLDQYTMDMVRLVRREAMLGDLPPSVPKGIPRPLLFCVYNLPESGSRCLVMYDMSGEVCNSISGVQEYVTSIKQVTTMWFLVSLRDLEKDAECKTITDLFAVYLSAMESLNVSLTGRNLIVVYTKADLEPSTKEVREYLMQDPHQWLTSNRGAPPAMGGFSLGDYVENMVAMSDYLEEYTWKRVRGGAAFLNMVKAQGMNLVFSITSALGQSPDPYSSRLPVEATRFRVLDPLLWAITLGTPESSTPVGPMSDAPSAQVAAVETWFVARVEELVRDDRLSDALTELSGISACRRDAILLTRQLKRIAEKERRGTISRTEADVERNRIADSILALLTSTSQRLL